jgi:four helix bundle protein
MQRFTDLKVWQLGHAFVLEVYRQTQRFPEQERYGLTAQLRRAAASVPTNIAEGSKRRQARDYARFLNIAEGSLAETEYLLQLSRDLVYSPVEPAAALLAQADQIARMLNALRSKVEQAAASEALGGVRPPGAIPARIQPRPNSRPSTVALVGSRESRAAQGGEMQRFSWQRPSTCSNSAATSATSRSNQPRLSSHKPNRSPEYSTR